MFEICEMTTTTKQHKTFPDNQMVESFGLNSESKRKRAKRTHRAMKCHICKQDFCFSLKEVDNWNAVKEKN